jgi:hypothetical protein
VRPCGRTPRFCGSGRFWRDASSGFVIEKKAPLRYDNGLTQHPGTVSRRKQSEQAMSASPSPSGDDAHPQKEASPRDDAHPQEEAPMGAAQQVDVDFSTRNIVRVVIVNVLVLSELGLALYMAYQNPEEFQPVFLKVFFALLVPTLILSSISKRLLRPKAKQ